MRLCKCHHGTDQFAPLAVAAQALCPVVTRWKYLDRLVLGTFGRILLISYQVRPRKYLLNRRGRFISAHVANHIAVRLVEGHAVTF